MQFKQHCKSDSFDCQVVLCNVHRDDKYRLEYTNRDSYSYFALEDSTVFAYSKHVRTNDDYSTQITQKRNYSTSDEQIEETQE